MERVTYYDALIKKGFSKDEALKIVTSVGMPSMPSMQNLIYRRWTNLKQFLLVSADSLSSNTKRRFQLNQHKETNWWGRNWKWFVPVGCLGTLVLFVCFTALIIFFVFGLIKSSDVYNDAIAKVKTNPSVQEIIGTPIEEGIFISGSIKTSGPSGNASISIPVSGPKGKGTIFVEAEKSAGQWTFSTLVLEIKETKQRIDLLE